MSRGKFVALEGGDANGKQTQSKLLAEKFDALLISFPRYETEIGKLIKANLKGELTTAKWSGEWMTAEMRPETMGSKTMVPECEDVGQFKAHALIRQALFTLDRYDAASEISDALANGRNVVADRYWLSGRIYGASDAVDARMLERVHVCLPQPDVWVLLDVPVEESFRRRPERQDVYERDPEKLEEIRRRYFGQFVQRSRFVHKGSCPAAREAHLRHGFEFEYRCNCDVRKWVIINGLGSIEEVHNRIMEVI